MSQILVVYLFKEGCIICETIMVLYLVHILQISRIKVNYRRTFVGDATVSDETADELYHILLE